MLRTTVLIHNLYSSLPSPKLQFKQNPYFSNSEIEKEFHLHDDEVPSGPTSTAIKWLPGKSLVAKATNGAGSKRKNEEVQVQILRLQIDQCTYIATSI